MEREVEKARDAETLLEGAKELLETLKAKLAADDSWASKRRIVEALVAGVEVESHLDPCAPRGKARKTSLRISYRFEVPDFEDAAPRTAKTPLAPSGLTLHRAHENLTLVADAHSEAHSEAREAAKELLRANPKLQGTEVVVQLQARGLLISPASVSRLRAGLKAAGEKERHPIGNTEADAALSSSLEKSSGLLPARNHLPPKLSAPLPRCGSRFAPAPGKKSCSNARLWRATPT